MNSIVFINNLKRKQQQKPKYQQTILEKIEIKQNIFTGTKNSISFIRWWEKKFIICHFLFWKIQHNVSNRLKSFDEDRLCYGSYYITGFDWNKLLLLKNLFKRPVKARHLSSPSFNTFKYVYLRNSKELHLTFTYVMIEMTAQVTYHHSVWFTLTHKKNNIHSAFFA